MKKLKLLSLLAIIFAFAITGLAVSYGGSTPADALQADVYQWETKGGASLPTTAVAPVDGRVKLSMQFDVYEDAALSGSTFGAVIADATVFPNNYSYASAKAIWFGITAAGVPQTFNNGGLTSAITSTGNDNQSSALAEIMKAGNTVRFEVDKTADAITAGYYIKAAGATEWTTVLTYSGSPLFTADSYALALQINTASKIRIYNIVIKDELSDTALAFDTSKSSPNCVSYGVIDVETVKYAVNFKYEDGTAIKSVEVEDGVKIAWADVPAAAEKRNGERFDYWADEQGKMFNFSAPITNETSVIAKYTPTDGTAGIANIVYKAANANGWQYALQFDAYIGYSAGQANWSIDNADNGLRKTILVDGKTPSYVGGYWGDNTELWLNDEMRNADYSINNTRMYFNWIQKADLTDGKAVVTVKEGTAIGSDANRNGTFVLDRDWKFLFDSTTNTPSFTFLANVTGATVTDNKYVDLTLDTWGTDDIASLTASGLTVNDESIATSVAYFTDDLSKTYRIDLSQLSLGTVTKIKFAAGTKVNQNAVMRAISTFRKNDAILENDYVCYVVNKGGNLTVYTDPEAYYGYEAVNAKENYNVGEEFDLSKVTVTRNKVNGESEPVSLEGATVTGYDKDVLGEQTVSITLGDETFTVVVTVNDFVNGITATTEKTEYRYGEEFDKTSVTVKYTLSKGGEGGDVTEFEVSGYDKNVLGEQTITITADEYTDTVTVTVVDYIASYEVIWTKTQYELGEEISADDFTVTEVYASGAKGETVAVTGVIGYDKDTEGEQTVYVNYGEDLTSEVTVLVVKTAQPSSEPVTSEPESSGSPASDTEPQESSKGGCFGGVTATGIAGIILLAAFAIRKRRN